MAFQICFVFFRGMGVYEGDLMPLKSLTYRDIRSVWKVTSGGHCNLSCGKNEHTFARHVALQLKWKRKLFFFRWSPALRLQHFSLTVGTWWLVVTKKKTLSHVTVHFTLMFSTARRPILFSASATVLNDMHETKVIKWAYHKGQKIHKSPKTRLAQASHSLFLI